MMSVQNKLNTTIAVLSVLNLVIFASLDISSGYSFYIGTLIVSLINVFSFHSFKQ